MENPKLLVSAGCSFTQPQNGYSTNWPVFLADYLGCSGNSVHLGKSSADNSYIADSVLHSLSKLKNSYNKILVGVMWTGINRRSFLLKDPPDDYYKMPGFFNGYGNPIRIDSNESNYYLIGPTFPDKWSKLFYKHFHDEIGSLISAVKNMLLVQNFCKVNNIKYFFSEYSWDSVSVNANISHPSVSYLYNMLDKSNFLPVATMSYWCENFSSLPFVPGDNHPTTEMSQAFVQQVIVPYLKDKGYIDK